MVPVQIGVADACIWAVLHLGRSAPGLSCSLAVLHLDCPAAWLFCSWPVLQLTIDSTCNRVPVADKQWQRCQWVSQVQIPMICTQRHKKLMVGGRSSVYPIGCATETINQYRKAAKRVPTSITRLLPSETVDTTGRQDPLLTLSATE